jgi:hypothetical protein
VGQPGGIAGRVVRRGRVAEDVDVEGRSVSAKVSSIIARAWAAVLAPMPSAPRPPALDTAAASRGDAGHRGLEDGVAQAQAGQQVSGSWRRFSRRRFACALQG